jgi:histidinol dehydrogenase
MPIRLDAAAADFASAFEKLLHMKRETAEDVDTIVRDIIADVILRGDDALIDYSRRFDRIELTSESLRISAEEVDAAVAVCPQDQIDALKLARDRIVAFHERQRPENLRFTDAAGVELGWRWSAVESVGLYVPGGTASYPSSVLMNALPAKVAGVERLVMVAPAPDGKLHPLVLAAARLAGVDEIYRVGGAQAVAALAYGTARIAPVAKIVGPGNAFVAAAKRRVFGQVGIDMIAGPSEVLILADKTANPNWIAIDLLAQAEHDTAAQSILITDDAGLADAVEAAVAERLKTLPRQKIAEKSWSELGAIVLVESLEQAVPLADRIAAEHLEIMAADAEGLAGRVRNAGAIFIGAYTPEAIGDYVGGSNHVLPTARSARFSSGLNVLDFMKRTSILKCSPESLRVIGPAAVTLGKAERLDAHALSVALRLEQP